MLPEMRFLLKMIPIARPSILKAGSLTLLVAMFGAGQAGARHFISAQNNEQVTPMQRELERQRQRLKSEDTEERRDALMRLGNSIAGDGGCLLVRLFFNRRPQVAPVRKRSTPQIHDVPLRWGGGMMDSLMTATFGASGPSCCSISRPWRIGIRIVGK